MRALIALSLVVTYFVHLMLTIRASSKSSWPTGTPPKPTTCSFWYVWFGRLGLREGMAVVVLKATGVGLG